MTGNYLCLIALISCFAFSVKSMLFGLISLMTWGYFFGILKANYVDSSGLFIFDFATLGFYFGLALNGHWKSRQYHYRNLVPWTIVLIAWPVFMALIPIQHYLVQIIGLRGNIFWLPMMLVGSIISPIEKSALVLALCILNFISFCFALGEFWFGVEYFIPENNVTRIVYDSNDLKDGARRIPSIFTNAHSYSLFMVATIPWIIGELLGLRVQKVSRLAQSVILTTGLVCALLGVFIAGPRQPVVALGLLLLLIVFSRNFNLVFMSIVMSVGGFVGYFVAQEERMQRFTSLQNLELVQQRIQTSLSMDFFEILLDYPMGNGMGGGGTSLPYFAQELLIRSVILENEYSRILLEQGLPGLLIFLSFFLWFFSRQVLKSDPLHIQKIYVKFYCIICVLTAFIGIGLMTSIPGTAFLLLSIGYSISPIFVGPNHNINLGSSLRPISQSIIPAYQRGLAKA